MHWWSTYVISLRSSATHYTWIISAASAKKNFYLKF